ncbi:hypothetical protein RhiJN_17238 [Ceratobasidium sp. AG-Ba]|nr:hypothetical protein RhiJN_17238 [Ceratobasidium sp. AG-Ba]
MRAIKVRDPEHSVSPVFTALKHIPLLDHLRSLSLPSSCIDAAALYVIGNLPLLETLSIHASALHRPSWALDHCVLPVNSFAALRHLELYRISLPLILGIFEQTVLLRNLDCATVVLPWESYDEHHEPPTSLCIVESLAHSRPELTRLMLTIDDNRRSISSDWRYIKAFKRLALRYLNLDSPFLCIRQAHGGPHWDDFFGALPDLEELRLPGSMFEMSVLDSVQVKLPKLLVLEVAYIGPRMVIQLPPRIPSLNPLIIYSRGFFTQLTHRYPGYIIDFVRNVHRLWPNAKLRVPEADCRLWYRRGQIMVAEGNYLLELLRSDTNEHEK